MRLNSLKECDVLFQIIIFPGDVILREEPYAAVLESIFRVNHCAHCLRKTPTPIPCYECATVSSITIQLFCVSPNPRVISMPFCQQPSRSKKIPKMFLKWFFIIFFGNYTPA
jgi:hypothetical protein